MSHLSKLNVPRLDGVDITLTPEGMHFRGIIAIADPGTSFGGFFRSVHDAALADGLKEFVADVRQLTFVNSSAIRLFVDWANWLTPLGADRYLLRFRTDRRVTWQRTSFAALQSLTGKAIAVDAE
jgi:hypothetical protein